MVKNAELKIENPKTELREIKIELEKVRTLAYDLEKFFSCEGEDLEGAEILNSLEVGLTTLIKKATPAEERQRVLTKLEITLIVNDLVYFENLDVKKYGGDGSFWKSKNYKSWIPNFISGALKVPESELLKNQLETIYKETIEILEIQEKNPLIPKIKKRLLPERGEK